MTRSSDSRDRQLSVCGATTTPWRSPDVRYEPVRIERVFSLGSEQCYLDADGLNVYLVFTSACTDEVLLECSVYSDVV